MWQLLIKIRPYLTKWSFGQFDFDFYWPVVETHKKCKQFLKPIFKTSHFWADNGLQVFGTSVLPSFLKLEALSILSTYSWWFEQEMGYEHLHNSDMLSGLFFAN